MLIVASNADCYSTFEFQTLLFDESFILLTQYASLKDKLYIIKNVLFSTYTGLLARCDISIEIGGTALYWMHLRIPCNMFIRLNLYTRIT
jgi:hypothetical protein